MVCVQCGLFPHCIFCCVIVYKKMHVTTRNHGIRQMLSLYAFVFGAGAESNANVRKSQIESRAHTTFKARTNTRPKWHAIHENGRTIRRSFFCSSSFSFAEMNDFWHFVKFVCNRTGCAHRFGMCLISLVHMYSHKPVGALKFVLFWDRNVFRTKRIHKLQLEFDLFFWLWY